MCTCILGGGWGDAHAYQVSGLGGNQRTLISQTPPVTLYVSSNARFIGFGLGGASNARDTQSMAKKQQNQEIR